MKSELFKLIKSDWLKGLAMVIVVSILTVIYSALPKVGLAGIDWGMVLQTGLTAGIGYIIKQFGTDEKGKLGGKI